MKLNKKILTGVTMAIMGSVLCYNGIINWGKYDCFKSPRIEKVQKLENSLSRIYPTLGDTKDPKELEQLFSIYNEKSKQLQEIISSKGFPEELIKYKDNSDKAFFNGAKTSSGACIALAGLYLCGSGVYSLKRKS